MAKQLEIVLYPDPVLRQRTRPIDKIDARIRELADRMLATMHAAPGVGLAAPQVGAAVRLFVADPSGEGQADEVYINPELEPVNPQEAGPRNEGCLSLPEIRGEITRPQRIRIRYTRLDGARITAEDDGLAARIWQHEFDHLEGNLIIDRMPAIDRLANRKLLKELSDRYEKDHPKAKAGTAKGKRK